jgi:hypothetical protein
MYTLVYVGLYLPDCVGFPVLYGPNIRFSHELVALNIDLIAEVRFIVVVSGSSPARVFFL